MIKRLNYQEIDFEKYQTCLSNSAQYKYSAEKQFLDITSDKKWDLLVYNDYEAVMPVPYIKKMGLKLAVNPKLCQQLGIFSSCDSTNLNDLFLEIFVKKYNIWYYAFNESNRFTTNLKKRKNYLIPPDRYETVRAKYSPKRKRKLRLDEDVLQNSSIVEIDDFGQAQSFIELNMVGLGKQRDLKEYLRIFEALYKQGYLKFYGFIYQSELINLIAIHYSAKSATLLGTFNNRNFVKLSGASVLIDYIIKQTIENRIFDFEGSEIPSVEEFFRGFRPELKEYSVLSYTKKEVFKTFFRF